MGGWRVRLAAGLLLILLTVIAFVAARIAQTLPYSPLFETFGYLGIFLLTMCCSATLFLPAPAFGAVGVAGGILNPVLVGLAAGMGAATGELTGYLAGRSGRVVLGADSVGWAERFRGWVARHGFVTLLLMALIPNPLFDLAGVTAGSLAYPVRRYWVAVAIGKALNYSIIALIGSALTPLWSAGASG